MKKNSMYLKVLNRIKLRYIILVPVFLIVIFGAAFSYFQVNRFVSVYSQKLIASNQLRIKNHIFDHLNDYFQASEQINKLNVILVERKQVSLEDEVVLGRLLLDQVHSNKAVDYAYFANQAGGIVSSGLFNKTSRIAYTPGLEKGSFDIYELGEDESLSFVKSIENFDPRTRSWYSESIKTRNSYWTEVYSGAQEAVLGMSTSLAVRDEAGKVIGVFGTDVLLTELSNFLKGIKLSDKGIICLVDEQGYIVAASTDEKPFKYIDGSEERLLAVDSANPIIRTGFSQEQLEDNIFSVEGYTYQYDFSEYSFDDKINWTIMIAVPRQDLLDDIERIFLRFSWGFLIIIVLMLIIYYRISNWILEPIVSLNDKVKLMVNNNWGLQIQTQRTDELGQLTNSFNDMSYKLNKYLSILDHKQEELEDINANLELMVKERTKELEWLSITDSLTEIYNKRYLMNMLETSIQDAKKFKMPFSVVIFDLDYFKSINDTYGHMEGDVVLRTVADFLKHKVHKTDIFGRYGGEEFMIIMPNKSLDQAYKEAEHFRLGVSGLIIGNSGIKLTLSGGVSEYKAEDTVTQVLERADKNLYKAKESGRNRIIK